MKALNGRPAVRDVLRKPSVGEGTGRNQQQLPSNMPAVAAGSNSSSTSIVRPRRIVSTLEEERYFESEDEDEEGPLKQQLSQVPSSSATLESVNVYEVIPEDYKKHHQDAEPQMHYLKQVDEEESLSTLITAALQDIRLHQARIKASLLNDTTWLQTYSFAYDDAYQERVARREARLAYLNKLQRDATLILRELEDDKKVLLTQGERVQVKLARWQRALELFVYSPRQMNLDLLGLLEKLLEGTSEVSYLFTKQHRISIVSRLYPSIALTHTHVTLLFHSQCTGRRIVTNLVASISHVSNPGGNHTRIYAGRDGRCR